MNTREIDFWTAAGRADVAPEYINEIVATAADIAIIIDMTGRIDLVIVNPLNQTIGQLDHWFNRRMSDFLSEDSLQRFEDILGDFSTGKLTTAQSVELNHFDNANWDFPIRYTFNLTGRENKILMMGRDLRPIAELQQRLVKAQLALEKDYEAERDFRTRYRVVMETSRDALVMIDAATGKTVDLNAAAASLVGGEQSALAGIQFANFFESVGKKDLIAELISVSEKDNSHSIRLTATKTGLEFSLYPTLFRSVGENMILCRLDTESKLEGIAPELLDHLSSLYLEGSDAVIFTNAKGQIRSGNDAFLELCGMTSHSDLKGHSIDEYLARGSVDGKVLLENATRSGKMRLYSTKIRTLHGVELPVEISATHLRLPTGTGFAFVFRDVSRTDFIREARMPEGAQDAQNVVELVGSSPLKDIVAATTDVIERMCIQAAVELTGNNRVAAAEMLGLSRQSLYVKLRKHGLLERNDNK